MEERSKNKKDEKYKILRNKATGERKEEKQRTKEISRYR